MPPGEEADSLLPPTSSNAFTTVVPETVALFADDVSLISSHYNKQIAEKDLQRAVTADAEWSSTPTNVK